MKREDIISMADEAGFPDAVYAHPGGMKMLETFAALVAAAEREACAKVCDEVGMFHEVAAGSDLAWELAAAIRARARATSTTQPPDTPALPPTA